MHPSTNTHFKPPPISPPPPRTSYLPNPHHGSIDPDQGRSHLHDSYQQGRPRNYQALCRDYPHHESDACQTQRYVDSRVHITINRYTNVLNLQSYHAFYIAPPPTLRPKPLSSTPHVRAYSLARSQNAQVFVMLSDCMV